MDVPATMTRWASSPVLGLADAFIARGLPDNVRLLHADHGLEARYAGQLEALEQRMAAEPLPELSLPKGSAANEGRSYLDSAIGPIHALRTPGDGPPVIALHPAGRSAATFQEDVAGHLQGRACWALDLPGHGASADLAEGSVLDAKALAEPLAQALKGAGLSNIEVIADGLGAQVALHLADHLSIAKITVLEPARLSADQLAVAQESGLPDLAPRMDASHLVAAWNFARSRRIFWPPWDLSAASQRPEPLSTDPQSVHAEVADMLRTSAHWRALVLLGYATDWDAMASHPIVTFTDR